MEGFYFHGGYGEEADPVCDWMRTLAWKLADEHDQTFPWHDIIVREGRA